MKYNLPKVITSALNLIVVVAIFEALIYILNLNQPEIFIRTAFYVGLFYILQIAIFYDLHFKGVAGFERSVWQRLKHFKQWHFVHNWFNYLILPGIIFWS